MTYNQTAIFLETVSFFLVTLDLFGKERLSDLYNRILLYLGEQKSIKFYDIFSKKMDNKGFLHTLIIQVGVIGLVLISYFFKEDLAFLESMRPENHGGFLDVLFTLFFFLLYISVFMFVVYQSVSIIDWLVNATLGNIVKLLYRFKLEGVMLLSGTVLFLISKAISFFN